MYGADVEASGYGGQWLCDVNTQPYNSWGNGAAILPEAGNEKFADAVCR